MHRVRLLSRSARRRALNLLGLFVLAAACFAGASSSAVADTLSWSFPTLIDGQPPFLQGLRSVSCPTTSLCVAVDEHGNVVTATNPTGGQGAWTTANASGNADVFLTSVSCPRRRSA